jgi:hypothetical protein
MRQFAESQRHVKESKMNIVGEEEDKPALEQAEPEQLSRCARVHGRLKAWIKDHCPRLPAWCFKKTFTLALRGFIIFCAITIAIMVVIRRNRKDDVQPIGLAGIIVPWTFDAIVEYALVDSGELLATHSNETEYAHSKPSLRAIKWLETEKQYWNDSSTFNLEHFQQRYLLAVFYFATRGPDTWFDQCGFLSNVHVCEWRCEIETLLEIPYFVRQDGTMGVGCDIDDRVIAIEMGKCE